MQPPNWSPSTETSTDAVLAKEATIRDILALQSSLSRVCPASLSPLPYIKRKAELTPARDR